MNMNWENIKYLFQLPLNWFKKIHDRVFNAYGTNFIRVRDGDNGGMNVDIDYDTFSQQVLEVTGGGSGGGTVKSVDGHGPDANGNVPLGAIRSINEHYYPDANGNIDVGLGVASVNGTLPDENGNVNVGTVRAVNGITPTAGNVDLGTIIWSVDGVGTVDFHELHLNAVRSVNGITTDSEHNYNVNIDAITEDQLATTLEDYVTETELGAALTPYVTGQALSDTLEDYVQTTVLESYVTNQELSDTLEDYVQISQLGDYVTQTELTTTLQNYVTQTSLATTLQNYAEIDDLGDLAFKDTVVVDGHVSDASGNVNFNLLTNKWLKTDASGHITTTDDKPIVVDPLKTGYVYNNGGTIEYKDEEYVTLTTNQQIHSTKQFFGPQHFKNENSGTEVGSIFGATISLATDARATPYIALQSGTSNGQISKTPTAMYISEDGILDMEGNVTNIRGTSGLCLHAPANYATLANAPDANATDLAIATVGYVNGKYVTLNTVQEINAVKRFLQNVVLKLKDVARDDASRTIGEYKQLAFQDKNNTSISYILTQAYTDGTNEMRIQLQKGDKTPWIRLLANNSDTHSVQIKATEQVLRAGDSLNDGRISISPRNGRVELFPNASAGLGGYIDFHLNGSSDDFTSRIIDNTDSLQLQVPSNSTRYIRLNAPANYSVLSNSPTIERTNKTSKAIATCGWTNTVVDAAMNNLPDFSKFVTLDTPQTLTATKTWTIQGHSQVSTVIRPGSVSCGSLAVESPSLGAVGRIVPSSSIGVQLEALAGGVSLKAPINQSTLVNPPNESAPDNCIATVGWVKDKTSGLVKTVQNISPDDNGNVDLGDVVSSVNGIAPDENGNVDFMLNGDSVVVTDSGGNLGSITGQTGAVGYVANVEWDGTRLVITRHKMSFDKGVLVSVFYDGTQYIDTVTYN